MPKEIRKLAQERVKKKKAFYTICTIFAVVSIILLVISFAVGYSGWSGRFWIRFPILIFSGLLSIIYVSMFGFPVRTWFSEDWEQVEVESELRDILASRPKALPPAREELSEEDVLELKELDRLKSKWEGDSTDFV